MNGFKIFTGNANPKLAESICSYLDVPVGKANVTRFSDNETWVEVSENVRGTDVFIVQPTSEPANDHLMEILALVDALKRASARRITTVLPYYGYARQDRKVAPRTPITAKLVADLIEAAGASRVLTMDLHAGQIQGFFNIPVDHLYAAPVLVNHLMKYCDEGDVCIVSPDAGGVERARAFAKRLNASLAIIDKRRVKANVSEVMHVIGDVDGKIAIVVDDMIDTAGTLTHAVPEILKRGATKVVAAMTHAVLSGPAIERINESELETLIVTNSIPLGQKGDKTNKIEVLSVAELLGEAIRRIHGEDSVSSLFI